MEAIAFAKYQQQLPIYVPQIEKKIFEELNAQAQVLQLPAVETSNFIQLIIQMSREIQENWLRTWREHQPKADSINDISFLRLEVKTLSIDILYQVVVAQLELSDPAHAILLHALIQQKMTASFVSAQEKQNVLNHLIAIANKVKNEA